MEDIKELTAAEWKIMRIVWEEQKAVTREIYAIAAQRHGWSTATVKTLLRRIIDKGYISVTKVGNGFLYRPAKSSLHVVKKAVESLLGNAVDGTGPLLVQLVEDAALSDDDLDSLQEMIAQKRSSIAKQKNLKARKQ
ncbi:MAG: BlaI/MecI/CopY family transcriptional regulator [Thermoguttaceae bacterium]